MGIKTDSFVIMATDMTAAKSILTYKKDQDKMFTLSDSLLMAAGGDPGDVTQFAEYIAKNIQLYRMRNSYDLSVKGAASFTRRNLADSLRTRSAYQVNLLIGGHDKTGGPGLYYMDYLGTNIEVPFAVHGYGSYFTLSVMDRMYHQNMSEADAVHMIQLCVNELAGRFPFSLGKFRVRIIDKNGIRLLPDVSPTTDPAAVTIPAANDDRMEVV